MHFSERLRSLRESRNISRKALAASLGIPYSTLRNYEMGIHEPGHKMLIDLARYFGVTVDDLIGVPSYSDPMACDAYEIARDYSALDSWGRRAVRTLTDIELERCVAAKPQPSITGIIPLKRSTLSASAGTGVYLGPEEFEIIFVRDTPLTRRAAFCLPVSGDSMEPLYFDGDTLLVEAADGIERGEIGIFTLDGAGYVKELGEGVLLSLNHEYAPVPLNDSARCNGRVIGLLPREFIVSH